MSSAADVYSDAAACRARRLDLVHRLGRLDVPRRRSNRSSASACRATRCCIDPCIPKSWPGFEIVFRYGTARATRSAVENPGGVSRGVAGVELDGVALPATAGADRRWPTTARPIACRSSWMNSRETG